MRHLVIFSLFCATILAVPTIYEDGKEADECTIDICKASEGCRCATSASPLDPNQQIPQLISLTFDEAISVDVFNIWKYILFDRTNPDGGPIGGTFFVPHEYTDYEKVNDLYNHGFEIGVKSITFGGTVNYWRDATEEVLDKEFLGQRKILNKFGNISEEDILGVRTPQFQLAGNYTFRAYQAAGLSYDSTWPTAPDKPLYPYTLDYLSTQQCNLGTKCPNEAFRGFWVLPINQLYGYGYGLGLFISYVIGTADEIADWLVNEINIIRSGTRVPLTLLVHTYWFEFTDNSLAGFIQFLDRLASYDDVFLVTQKQVLDWIDNPVPLSEFKTDFPERNAACTPYSCKLKKPDGDERYLKSCIPCPASYPWLDNPDGN